MVDLLDEKEDHESDDDKIDERIQEDAVVDGGRSRCLRFGQGGVVASGEIDIEIGKVDFVEDEPDGRHDDIADQGGDDFAESGADDNTDRHIHHIAFDGEFFELFEHRRVFKDEKAIPLVYRTSGRNKKTPCAGVF